MLNAQAEKFVPEAAATEKTGDPIILIAEDNEDDVLFLRWALEKAGLGKSSVFVKDGEEAVNYLSRQPPFDDPVLCPKPNLVLLDGRMPKMDALDVLLWLHRHPQVEPPNLLVYTSALTPEQRVRAVTLGAKACVDKPVTGEDWSSLVQQIKRFSAGLMLLLQTACLRGLGLLAYHALSLHRVLSPIPFPPPFPKGRPEFRPLGEGTPFGLVGFFGNDQ